MSFTGRVVRIKIMNSVYKKSLFDIPDNVIYLDGNSLGPLQKGIPEVTEGVVKNEWGNKLIKGWNEENWMTQPRLVGNKIAKIVGAPKNSIVAGDTLSIKLYQALAAAINLRKDRKIILTDSGNFPSDLYIAEGLIESLGDNFELKIVKPEDLITSITSEVGVVMLTHVDYRTGRMHDLEKISSCARKNGAAMLWDLAHSAGAVPVNLKDSKCEFAVGCTYKFLNGGPGAPAFIYIRPDLIKDCYSILRGWLGHKSPFDFDHKFKKAETIDAMRIGTPAVVQMSILDKALEIWSDIDMREVKRKSIQLSELFIHRIEEKCLDIRLASPRDPKMRGSQISFFHKNGYAVIQALIDKNIIGDFRAPNIMRFGISPLYNNENDVLQTVDSLEEIIKNKTWNQKKFLLKKPVT